MKKSLIIGAVLATGAFAAVADDGRLQVTADRVAADNVTGAMAASGHVDAVCAPYHLKSDYIHCDENGKYTLSDPSHVTTCSNRWEDLHWRMTGEVVYDAGHSVVVRNAVGRLFEVPVIWLPYWYYPLDTDYGFRFMPGYSRRWGCYLMTKYVYRLAGTMDEGEYGLDAATRADWRAKNGFAVGQDFAWNLGEFGAGGFRSYFAWDEDYDRYDRHWSDAGRYNYCNWGSEVERDRYALEAFHRWNPTERDTVRGRVRYLSDSHFLQDLLSRQRFGLENDIGGYSENELAWEHNESYWGLGVSVSGPVNDFYGGTARLPEAYVDVMPQPVFSTPVNYESETRIGFLNRDPAEYGNAETSPYYRYRPGAWADYQCFRADTYHRLTLPMKAADVVSIVPRVAVRGTDWSASGYPSESGLDRSQRVDSDVQRVIAEGGVTFSARGRGDIGDGCAHVVEPYLDVLFQEANYNGLEKGARPYVFDAVDASRGWLDQFAGRSRNLPYSYYGMTPGVRNVIRKTEENGVERDYFEVDTYVAVQFNDTSYSNNGTDANRRLTEDPEDPNWGEDAMYVPGARMVYHPTSDLTLGLRGEWNSQDETLAYASAMLRHQVDRKFSWYADYICRDHRLWDFSASPFDRSVMNEDIYNRAHFQYFEVGCEHEISDAWAWGPYLRWDLKEEELDEIGAWIDYRLDCLGFRLAVSYENEFELADGSTYEKDYSVGFYMYLRAFGPNGGGKRD